MQISHLSAYKGTTLTKILLFCRMAIVGMIWVGLVTYFDTMTYFLYRGFVPFIAGAMYVHYCHVVCTRYKEKHT